MSKSNSNSSSSKKTVARSAEAPAKRVRRASGPEVVEVVDPVAVTMVSDDQVAALAYRYFVEGGYEHGHAMEHWLRAETALRGR
jgi:hypothetical protein